MNNYHESQCLNSNKNFKLAFKDLNYTINSKVPFVKNETKTILKRISGEFRSNQLTAIVGLSGSGKSSLLDCLSGFRVNNISGTITYNDEVITTRKIKEVSSYFMQEQMLHVFLTVKEIINFAINVKCHKKLSDEEKELKMENILNKLDISDLHNSFIKDLSGGERKRIQIAIELVDDPKIIFADETTTNLDIVASMQCIKILKDIANEGRMIILTIHQPSATMLPMFDHIYALNSGNCIYQGTSENLIKFFDDIELPCPSTYNPMDYLMEIANNQYGDHSQLLVEKSQNGSNLEYGKEIDRSNTIDIFKKPSDFKDSSASYFLQVYYLMIRIFINTFRNKRSVCLRFGSHIVIGTVLGLTYRNVGNNASRAIDNIHSIFSVLSFLFFTAYHSHYMTFPLEFPIIKREHFNGWYSAKAYYTSFILADFPILFLNTTILCTILYVLTDQPHDIKRFLLFLSFHLIFAFDAQAMAIMATSLHSGGVAVIVSQLSLLPFYSLSSCVVHPRDTLSIFKLFFDLNFFNAAFTGSTTAVLGMNRTKLNCDDVYCHFNDPKKILKDLGSEIDLINGLTILLIYFVVFHFTAFMLIRYKLKFKH